MNFKKMNVRTLTKVILSFIVCGAMWVSCTEDVDTSARYVFKEKTAMDYLEKYSDVYSEYLHLLEITHVSIVSETTVAQLLKARGHYTVFAPTNEAIYAYLDTLVKEELISAPSWDAFTDSTKLDSIRKVIVYNSIIDSGDADQPYDTWDFPTIQGGEIPHTNMGDRKVTVYYGGTIDTIYLFNKFKIDPRNKDILVLNGILHQMQNVIAPKNITATVYLQEIVDKQKEGFLVMARCMMTCGLKDTLNAIRDEVYEELYKRGQIPDCLGMTDLGLDVANSYAPEHRKYGYTIFAEPDTYWREQGIDPKDPDLFKTLTQWILDNKQYSEEDNFVADENYTSENNLLHLWTTYHLLPMKLPADKLVTHNNELGYTLSMKGQPSVAVYEIYTTMGKRRLVKIYQSRESDGIFINRFPKLDNGRKGTYHELSCDPDKVGCKILYDSEEANVSDMVNCNIYPIDAPMSYNDNVRDNLMRQRLRFEAQALLPEAVNNDIRQNYSSDAKKKYVYAPADNIYRYFDDLWQGDQTYTTVIDYQEGNPSVNADEIKSGGYYDVTFRLPPVPRRGTYEFRFAVLNRTYRGVAQLYLSESLDNRVVTGIPIDMTQDIWDAPSGWERDSDDPDYNSEIDKRMHNLGYMKGCQQFNMRNRTDYSFVRQIATRKTMDPDKTYYITFKNVLDYYKELYTDYFELCAKEVYDNPVEPEDIW